MFLGLFYLCCVCAYMHVTVSTEPALSVSDGLQTRDEASKQLADSKKTAEAQWNAAQKQYQKATPANQKASKKTWDLAQKARDEVRRAAPSCVCAAWHPDPSDEACCCDVAVGSFVPCV